MYLSIAMRERERERERQMEVFDKNREILMNSRAIGYCVMTANIMELLALQVDLTHYISRPLEDYYYFVVDKIEAL